MICWKGKVLAGISVEAVEVTQERGPASVVRVIDHLEMATVCEHVVKRLELSGFVGFDFILDCANRAWLLEMNPRVTPICHFFSRRRYEFGGIALRADEGTAAAVETCTSQS